MQHNVELLEQSTTNFISLKRAKQYLRIDHEFDDEIIEEMIEIALIAAENYLGLKLKSSRWKMTIYDNLPSVIKLPHPPIRKIEHFKLYTATGGEIYLADHHYMANEFAEAIYMRVHLAMKKAEIIYHTGYETIWLPAPIRQGMLEHIAKLYDLRGSDHGLPLSVKSLYQPYKRVRF